MCKAIKGPAKHCWRMVEELQYRRDSLTPTIFAYLLHEHVSSNASSSDSQTESCARAHHTRLCHFESKYCERSHTGQETLRFHIYVVQYSRSSSRSRYTSRTLCFSGRVEEWVQCLPIFDGNLALGIGPRSFKHIGIPGLSFTKYTVRQHTKKLTSNTLTCVEPTFRLSKEGFDRVFISIVSNHIRDYIMGIFFVSNGALQQIAWQIHFGRL